MSQRRYYAGLQAQSALRINHGEALRFNYLEPDGKVLHVALTTRWADEGYEAAVPRELVSEVTGPATSLDAAIRIFRAASDTIGNLVAFATNVAREPSRLVVAFDITENETRHDFFQYFVPANRELPVQGRRPASESVQRFVAAVSHHSRKSRMLRAISQYMHALEFWAPGQEVEAVSHLWMGFEALKTVAVEHEVNDTGVADGQELATSVWGYEKNERGYVSSNEIEAHARRHLLFQADHETHRSAKKISDALEHGFDPGISIQTEAARIRNVAAGYLRSAVIRLSGLDAEDTQVLEGGLLAEPLATFDYHLYLRANLLGEASALLAPGEPVPSVEWSLNLASVTAGEKATDLRMQIKQSMTARLPSGVEMEPGSLEFWGPSGGNTSVDSTHTVVTTDDDTAT